MCINKARLLHVNGLSLSCFNSKTAQDCSKSMKCIMRVKITIKISIFVNGIQNQKTIVAIRKLLMTMFTNIFNKYKLEI